MTDKVALDLPLLLPDALDGRDRCVERLTSTLVGAPGLEEVHVVEAADGAPARLCLHFDPATTNLARIRGMAEAGGVQLTEQFGHVLWTVTGIGHARKARIVADGLRRLPGVVEAEVTPGLVRVELDRSRTDEAGVRAALDEPGVGVAGGRDGEAVRDGGADEHRHGGPFGERSELIFAISASWTRRDPRLELRSPR